MKLTAFAAVATAFPTIALADLTVQFSEGAPKDRFTLTNSGSCDTGAAVVVIDLSKSAGHLIFDTTAAGAGVEVFQPVELVSGSADVESSSIISDGDNRLEISLLNLKPQAAIAFTMDLDDQQTNSDLGQIMVSGAEISGAVVSVTIGGETSRGIFNDQSRAIVPLTACLS